MFSIKTIQREQKRLQGISFKKSPVTPVKIIKFYVKMQKASHNTY